MIIVKSNRFLDNPNSPIVSASCTMHGRFAIRKGKVDCHGKPIEASKVLLAEFDNLITNIGLDRVGSGGLNFTTCQVGTGTAVPLVTNTGLQTFLANSSLVSDTTSALSPGGPPYWGGSSRTYRFNAGVATGNLTEVGVGWSTGLSTLFSRALIVDGSGNPTTITVLADEFLDVTYTLRFRGPDTDQTGNVTITGVGTLTFTQRIARATSVTDWSHGFTGTAGLGTGTGDHVFYSGTLGPVTGNPSGSNASSSSGAVVNGTYTAGTYTRNSTLTLGLNNGNVAGGIRSSLLTCLTARGGGAFQTEFSSIIPKDATKILVLNTAYSWARGTP